MQSLQTGSGHSETTSKFVTRHLQMNARELPEVTGTAGGSSNCWKLQQVAGDAANMMKNAVSILIVIFLHNSNTPRPQTKSCLFSDLAPRQSLLIFF